MFFLQHSIYRQNHLKRSASGIKDKKKEEKVYKNYHNATAGETYASNLSGKII